MTKITIWGPSTWRFMHLLAHSLNDEATPDKVNEVFVFIYRICASLPCPDCLDHAKQFLTQIRHGALDTPEKLRQFLYIFHNSVNKRLKTPMWQYVDVCRLYDNIPIHEFIEHTNMWINSFNTNGNFMLMSENHVRTILKQDIQRWLYNNLRVINGKTTIK